MTIEHDPTREKTTVTICPMCSKWQDDSDLQILELEHSFLLLNRDQFFPGYCFLFTKNHVTELFHLDKTVMNGLMGEVTLAASALHGLFRPDKMNYELLGNMVPHLHWHLVPRFAGDALWPRPIWAAQHEELVLTPSAAAKRVTLIREAMEAAGAKG